MRSFRVELGPNAHPVHVGAGALEQLGRLARAAAVAPGRAALVTDSNVARLYGERVAASLRAAGFIPRMVEVAAGEQSKSLATLERVYDALVEAELDRASAVFALGGGVIGDLAGFAAATYMRGIALVQIPTTVVAQVDSALGGKTAVNHPRAKNLIGAFYQPRLVVADVSTLISLPEREFREGLAEVIKYGAIMDAAMVDALERGLDAILRREPAALEDAVERSLRHKAAVVASDEREGSLRRILNYGHTVGHALEASAGYGSLLHGEAVAIGMVAAGRLSQAFAGLAAADAARLERLLSRAGLPTAMPAGWRGGEEFARAMRLDKKRAGDAIEFILLDRLGHALTRKLSFAEILSGLG
ncbi:MAG TPA: 3-dehydroquinate synthase [Candidatus Binataceae bacterium]|jgi:3-dehydroquinate synthase|nr:3-dehydroquinate synthase [Candidatus Binataceae bacterium]